MNPQNIAADAGMAMKRTVRTKPKATPEAIKPTSMIKKNAAAGMREDAVTIGVHLSENRSFNWA